MMRDDEEDADYDPYAEMVEHALEENDLLDESVDVLAATGRRRAPSGRWNAREPFEFDTALLGDPDADEATRNAEWRRVFEHFDPRLDDFFSYQVPDPDERADLLSHIWRAAFLRFGGLDSPRAAWSYLLTVGKNYLRDRWEAETRQEQRLDRYQRHIKIEEEIRQELQNVLEHLAHEDSWIEGQWPIEPEEFAERMAQLSDSDRELILLRHVRGLTHEQAAHELGIRPATVRKRYSRILQHLRGAD